MEEKKRCEWIDMAKDKIRTTYLTIGCCVFMYLNYMVLGRTVGMWSNNCF